MRNVWFIVIVIFSIAHMCCKRDFLDNPPTSDPSRQSYIKDITTCEEYLNGIYVDISVEFYKSYNTIYPDLIADNIRPITGGNRLMAQYNWSQVANDNVTSSISASALNMNALWTAGYKIIRSCNYLLERVDQLANENITKVNRIKGEAYAIRALVHHQLVATFSQPYNFTDNASHSGIPYIKTSNWAEGVKRISVSEVYDNIIQDLTAASNFLPRTDITPVKLNHYSVMALLARICLFKYDFINAKKYSIEVMSDVPLLDALSYPSKLFTTDDTEAIFYLPPFNIMGYSTEYASYRFRGSIGFVATTDIAGILNANPNDKRNQWVHFDQVRGFIITKFPVDATSGMSDPEAAYFHPVIRTSEMYLICSESYARLGRSDSAIYYLDIIRRRADNTAKSTSAVGHALLDSIFKEKRKELCFEGTRMFELLRMGQGVVRRDESSSMARELPYPSNKAIAPIHSLDVNYYGLPQNEGYE